MTGGDDTQGCALIIYPEEAGNLLMPELRKQGIRCIGIHQPKPQTLTDAPLYHRTIYHDGEPSELYDVLSQYQLTCVLPGSEKGVPVADTIANHFGILPNAPQHAEARYDKSCMAKTAQAAGLNIPEQATITSERKLHALIAEGLNWPVILKPANSMGSEGVCLCTDTQQLKAAFHSIMNTKNRLARQNRACILQQYLTGTEYAVDTISYDGCHKVVAVWEYQKSTTDIIGVVPFTSKRLIKETALVQQRLQDYTNRLLDSLGIRYGPSHLELVIEKRDVLLMEIGARLHGGLAAMYVVQACTGYSQAEVCALAFANPTYFINNHPKRYTLSNYGEIALLIPPFAGLFINHDYLNEIRSLPSVAKLIVDTRRGLPLGKIAGLVQLIHEDAHVIDNDLHAIRRLEKSGLYHGNTNAC